MENLTAVLWYEKFQHLDSDGAHRKAKGIGKGVGSQIRPGGQKAETRPDAPTITNHNPTLQDGQGEDLTPNLPRKPDLSRQTENLALPDVST